MPASEILAGHNKCERTFFQVLTPIFEKSTRTRVEGLLRQRSHLVPEQSSRGQFSQHTFFFSLSTRIRHSALALFLNPGVTLFCVSAHECTISQVSDVNKALLSNVGTTL